jgi:hypothetical protein
MESLYVLPHEELIAIRPRAFFTSGEGYPNPGLVTACEKHEKRKW